MASGCSLEVDTTCGYTCHDGYIKSGSVSLVCNKNGAWNEEINQLCKRSFLFNIYFLYYKILKILFPRNCRNVPKRRLMEIVKLALKWLNTPVCILEEHFLQIEIKFRIKWFQLLRYEIYFSSYTNADIHSMILRVRKI